MMYSRTSTRPSATSSTSSTTSSSRSSSSGGGSSKMVPCPVPRPMPRPMMAQSTKGSGAGYMAPRASPSGAAGSGVRGSGVGVERHRVSLPPGFKELPKPQMSAMASGSGSGSGSGGSESKAPTGSEWTPSKTPRKRRAGPHASTPLVNGSLISAKLMSPIFSPRIKKHPQSAPPKAACPPSPMRKISPYVQRRTHQGVKTHYVRPSGRVPISSPMVIPKPIPPAGIRSLPCSPSKQAPQRGSRVMRPSLARRHERTRAAADGELAAQLRDSLHNMHTNMHVAAAAAAGGSSATSSASWKSSDASAAGLAGSAGLAEFEKIVPIATGKFTEILRVFAPKDGTHYVIKKELDDVRLPGLSLKHEVHIIRRLGVPPDKHVVLYEKAWEDSGVMHIQMEDCSHGSLEHYLTTMFPTLAAYPLDFVLSVLHDLGKGLSFIGKRGVVHMDIKPENVFVDRDGNLKLGDFGISYLMPQASAWDDSSDDDSDDDAPSIPLPGMAAASSPSSGEDGDPQYMAQELLKGGPIGPWVDVFSLGIMGLSFLLGLELPSRGDLWHIIRSGELGPIVQGSEAAAEYEAEHTPELVRTVYHDTLALITAMMSPDPSVRPAPADVVAGADALILKLHTGTTAMEAW